MKFIFLDIDGVLNNSDTFKLQYKLRKQGIHMLEIDRYMLHRLKNIIEQTNAVVVLSSTWRYGFNKNGTPKHNKGDCFELFELFKKYNIPIYGITTDKHLKERQDEIQYWFATHKDLDIESYVIIDDETCDLMRYVGVNKVVKTSNVPYSDMVMDMSVCKGLQEEHMNKAIKILNNY